MAVMRDVNRCNQSMNPRKSLQRSAPGRAGIGSLPLISTTGCMAAAGVLCYGLWFISLWTLSYSRCS